MASPSGDSANRPKKPYNASKARFGPRHIAGHSHSAGKKAHPKALTSVEAEKIADALDRLEGRSTRRGFQQLCFKKFRERGQ